MPLISTSPPLTPPITHPSVRAPHVAPPSWPSGSDFVPPQEETDCEVAKLAYEYGLVSAISPLPSVTVQVDRLPIGTSAGGGGNGKKETSGEARKEGGGRGG